MAFKSCGVSVYRIAMPILILGLLTSGFIFVLQEYALPYANVRQDSLRNIIKGRPAQVSQPGRHWIFGQDDRLYNYNLFSSERNAFVELAVYRLDLKDAVRLEAAFAQRGDWRRDAWTAGASCRCSHLRTKSRGQAAARRIGGVGSIP